MKTFAPGVRVVGVDAEGSGIFGGATAPYRIPGIGLGWTPTNVSLEFVDSAYKVGDEQAFLSARSFARHEGILMGPSSGACALVALKLAQELGPDDVVVCMVADGGDRYVHTLFNDEWMSRQGFGPDADIETIRGMARELRPWSESPAAGGNYRGELAESLEVPESTLRLNSEILARGYEHPQASMYID
jgi:cystathionine beta-synthase/cysteine synthase A